MKQYIQNRFPHTHTDKTKNKKNKKVTNNVASCIIVYCVDL